jgi:hypothetical protein
MARKTLVVCIFLALAISLAAGADTTSARVNLSAAEIVNKNVSARGGLQAWRAVHALSMMGKMDAGGNNRPTLPIPGRRTGKQMPAPRPAEQVQLPFIMELERPRKSRIELQFNGQTAVQVFDGAHGWKLRPFLNRREIEPFTPEEMKAAAMQADLDGFLIDYAAKGTKVDVVGMEKVENRDNYKLKLTLKNGESMHVWVDAQTFLETKIEGTPRRLDGAYHPVEIYFRDFRPVNGLMLPYLIETKVIDAAKIRGSKAAQSVTEKIVIEKVVLNPSLDQALFSKPQA